MPTLKTTRPVVRPPRDRRRRTLGIVLAIVGSLLLHALVLLGLVWVVPHWPRGHVHVHPKPIELMVVPPAKSPEPSGPLDAKGTPPPYIRTLDDQAADRPPDDPSFQSDKDTHAASERPADGNKPLPSTEGRELPSFDFEPRPYRPGTQAADAATSALVAPPATPVPANTPAPTATPDNKKLPAKSRPQRKPTTQPTPAATVDPASPQAESASSPEPLVPTPAETPRDTDNSSVPPPPRPGSQPPPTAAALASVTSKGAPKPPGYQTQSLATKMVGSINNRGRAAAAAIGTPLGRYEKKVSDAIGMLWDYQVRDHASELSTGTVRIHFYVDRDGRVGNVRFTGGNANGALGLISEQAVTEAQIDPMPPEVAAVLEAGQLEVDYSFSMYPF